MTVLSDLDVVSRSSAAIEAARFGALSRSSALEYTRVADRIERTRTSRGEQWRGLDDLALAASTMSVARAAWSRRSHLELARGLAELRGADADTDQALSHLRDWLPEAEACPPHLGCAPSGGSGAPRHASTASKRYRLASLPASWLADVWSAAVEQEARHLDAIAALIVTGCRPSEAAHGVGIRVRGGLLDVAIAGSKVTETSGQDWRLLTVESGDGGPADRLAALARAAGGRVTLRPVCTPGSLSMAVAELGNEIGLPGRVSAYDVRHQRSADVRIAFDGDRERVAAWLGHGGLTSVRYYGRLPTGTGIRGPRPVAASTSRPIRVLARRAGLEPTA